jgi:hypothetical protein
MLRLSRLVRHSRTEMVPFPILAGAFDFRVLTSVVVQAMAFAVLGLGCTLEFGALIRADEARDIAIAAGRFKAALQNYSSSRGSDSDSSIFTGDHDVERFRCGTRWSPRPSLAD